MAVPPFSPEWSQNGCDFLSWHIKVLPDLPSNSWHRCFRSPLAGHEAVRISAHQADSGSSVQGEGERFPSPTRSPVLAIPYVVLGADSSSVSAPLGDSDQAGPALSASGKDLAPSIRDLEAVGMAHPGPQVLTSSRSAEDKETIASARAPATRKLHSSEWKFFLVLVFSQCSGPSQLPY